MILFGRFNGQRGWLKISWVLCLFLFAYLAGVSAVLANNEKEIGTWTVVSDSVLVIKEVDGKKWLLQTNEDRSYYVVRGKNFLSRDDVVLDSTVNPAELANDVTAKGGLMPAKRGKFPTGWPMDWWIKQGFTRNDEGEFVREKQSADTSLTAGALEELAEGQELKIGRWSVVPESFIIVKKISGKYWLLQTTPDNRYYVVRGKNHLDDKNVTVDAAFNKASIKRKLANETTGIGGLMPAANGRYPVGFPVRWWHARNYAQNEEGEWVLVGNEIPADAISIEPGSEEPDEAKEENSADQSGEKVSEPKVPANPKPAAGDATKPKTGKIKIPVGVISWDAWYTDYWNKRPEGIPDNKWQDMKLINITTMNRYVLSYIKEKYNQHLVPFWGQQNLPPENVKIYTDVKWDQAAGRNVYKEHTRPVTVAFNLDQKACDKELDYMAKAGIDYILFNFYRDDSPLSLARQLYVASTNKQGVKMSLIMGSGKEDSYVNYITDLMMQDYWFKIDGKPVMFFWPWNTTDQLQLYRNAYAKKSGGGELYVSIMREGCYFGDEDVQKMVNENIDAVSAYSQTTDGNTHAESIMRAEVNGRNEVRTRMPDKDIIPNMTLGVENYFCRNDLVNKGDEFRKEKASLAEIDEKFASLAGFIDANHAKVKTFIIYSWNEICESGLPICPTLNADGSINTDVIDRISEWIK